MNTPNQQQENKPHAMICENCLYEDFRPPLGTGQHEICPVCGKEMFRTVMTRDFFQYMRFLQSMRIFNGEN